MLKNIKYLRRFGQKYQIRDVKFRWMKKKFESFWKKAGKHSNQKLRNVTCSSCCEDFIVIRFVSEIKQKTEEKLATCAELSKQNTFGMTQKKTDVKKLLVACFYVLLLLGVESPPRMLPLQRQEQVLHINSTKCFKRQIIVSLYAIKKGKLFL